MRIVAIIISLLFIFSCLRDAFETIVLPRKSLTALQPVQSVLFFYMDAVVNASTKDAQW